MCVYIKKKKRKCVHTFKMCIYVYMCTLTHIYTFMKIPLFFSQHLFKN